jgi:hypothetical protein
MCLVFYIYNFFCPFTYLIRPHQILSKNLSDIKVDTTISVLNIHAAAHNKILIDVLQERLAIEYSNLNSNLSIKMQFRLFYTAILAGLSSLFFHKDIMWKSFIRITLLFLIIMMYLLEVHFDDLYRRQKDFSIIMYNSADSLISLKPNDSTWYDFKKWDTSDVKANWDSVSTNGSIYRKLKEALSPDVEQMVYYLIPWSVLFIVPPYYLNKKKEFQRKYGSPKYKN